MPSGPPAPPRPSKHIVVMIFVAVLGSFLVSMGTVTWAARDIEVLSHVLVYQTTPGIEALTVARRDVLEVEHWLAVLVNGTSASRASAQAHLEEELGDLEESVQGYLTLPLAQGEASQWQAVYGAWARFHRAALHTVDLVEDGDVAGSRGALAEQAEPRAREMLDALAAATTFNIEQASLLASGMHEARQGADRLAVALASVCVVVGIAGAAMVLRLEQAQRRLYEAYARTFEERATELEQFAGRVAHDLRNPIAAATLGAQLLRRRPEDAPSLTERILRSLWTADALIEDLLAFARSGGPADPGARVAVADAIDDLVATLRTDGSARDVDLRVDVQPLWVFASRGVYFSPVANLARNALKYMGEGAGPRRVEIRVTSDHGCVRTEITDTGPGIPPDRLPSIFQPYVRAHTGSVGGLGLGLATVRRLAKGHQGSVGVRSVLGRGSTFWFVLPQATPGEGAPVDASSPTPLPGPHPH